MPLRRSPGVCWRSRAFPRQGCVCVGGGSALQGGGSPGLGAGENPEVPSRAWVPPGSRPLACAFASSMACFLFSTSLSRYVRSTWKSQAPPVEKRRLPVQHERPLREEENQDHLLPSVQLQDLQADLLNLVLTCPKQKKPVGTVGQRNL